MKLVAWNANQGLRRKLRTLLDLKPDIAVISEAAHPDAGGYGKFLPPQATTLWVGDDPNKGLLTIDLAGRPLTLDSGYDPANRHIAPIKIGGRDPLHLLAVWSDSDRKAPRRSLKPNPILRTIRSTERFCREAPLLVAGDFNHNTIWDARERNADRRMATIIESLANLGLESGYHATTAEEFGGETEPTLYWRTRSKDGKTYHVDYIFLPRSEIRATGFGMGSFDDWVGSGLSDHVPVWVEW